MGLRCILKIELIEFVDVLDVKYERKSEVRIMLKFGVWIIGWKVLLFIEVVNIEGGVGLGGNKN